MYSSTKDHFWSGFHLLQGFGEGNTEREHLTDGPVGSWQPDPRLGLSRELSSGSESAGAPQEHLTRQLLSSAKLQDGKHSPEGHSVGQDRHLLSLLRLSPREDSISTGYCQGSSLERGELCVRGAARLLFSPH